MIKGKSRCTFRSTWQAELGCSQFKLLLLQVINEILVTRNGLADRDSPPFIMPCIRRTTAKPRSAS